MLAHLLPIAAAGFLTSRLVQAARLACPRNRSWSPRKGCLRPAAKRIASMNAFSISFEGHLLDYQADYRRTSEADKSRRTRRTGGTKRGIRPSGFNGMHRRRQKRWTW